MLCHELGCRLSDICNAETIDKTPHVRLSGCVHRSHKLVVRLLAKSLKFNYMFSVSRKLIQIRKLLEDLLIYELLYGRL